MRTKPARRLPVMLPTVDQKKTSPATLPTPIAGTFTLCSLIAYGDSIPRKNAGSRNSSAAETSGPLSIDSDPLKRGRSSVPIPCSASSTRPLTRISPKKDRSEGFRSASAPPA